MDRTDIRIIEELKDDGRQSFNRIAEKLNLATSTVSARVNKLEEKGVITSYKPVIDYEEAGFELTAMIDVTARAEKIQEVAEKLESDSRVISFFEVTGKTDMILVARFFDREDMNSTIKRFQKIEGLESTETHIVLTTPILEGGVDLNEVIKEI
jgi:Lrp/AsnC family transcriptional regulator for asnA, asnC and gidA